MKVTAEATTKLIAYKNDPKIKEKYVLRVKAHAKADEIIQGLYWENGKGCLVGCATHTSNDPHQVLQDKAGIPWLVSRCADRIFEGSSNSVAKTLPVRFFEAIPVGADLSLVPQQLALWILTSPDSLYTQVLTDEADKKIFADVAELYRRHIAGDKPTEQEWEAVEAVAREASNRAWNAYHSTALDLDLALALALDLDRDLALALALDLDRALALALALARALARALDLDLDRDRDLTEKFFALAGEELVRLLAAAPVVEE